MNASFNGQPVINGDMSADVISQPSDLWRCTSASYEVEYTGTPTGDFEVWVTDHWDNRTDPTYANFKELTLASPIAAAAGAPGNALVDLTDIPFRWVQLRYDRTGGTGTMNAWIAGKA